MPDQERFTCCPPSLLPYSRPELAPAAGPPRSSEICQLSATWPVCTASRYFNVAKRCSSYVASLPFATCERSSSAPRITTGHAPLRVILCLKLAMQSSKHWKWTICLPTSQPCSALIVQLSPSLVGLQCVSLKQRLAIGLSI